MQRFTSANTSINKSRLPKIYNLLDKISNCVVVDYGCGRYTDHIREWAKDRDIQWFGYDKYNQDSKTNDTSINKLNEADYVVCSNVLNVIAEDDIILDIVRECTSNSGKAIFTIYDGNKSGVGKQTGKDQYQRNQKVKWYLDFIRDNGYDAKMWKGSIVVG